MDTYAHCCVLDSVAFLYASFTMADATEPGAGTLTKTTTTTSKDVVTVNLNDLVLALRSISPLEELRRPRDDFERAADPVYCADFAKCAMLLEIVAQRRVSSKSKEDEDHVFRSTYYRGLFERGLKTLREHIESAEAREFAETFDIDLWFRDMITVERESTTNEDGTWKIMASDWFDALSKWDTLMPGFIQLLTSTLTNDMEAVRVKQEVYRASMMQDDVQKSQQASRAELFRQNRADTVAFETSVSDAARARRFSALGRGRR
jgi:hypothetical protein